MKQRPRAKCPVCGGNVALHKSGQSFRAHKDKSHTMYGTGQNDLVPYCDASCTTLERAQLIAAKKRAGKAVS